MSTWPDLWSQDNNNSNFIVSIIQKTYPKKVRFLLAKFGDVSRLLTYEETRTRATKQLRL